jgi:hypothetical protein
LIRVNEVSATAINGQRYANCGSALSAVSRHQEAPIITARAFTSAGRFSPLGPVGFSFAYRMDNNVVVLSTSAGAFG